MGFWPSCAGGRPLLRSRYLDGGQSRSPWLGLPEASRRSAVTDGVMGWRAAAYLAGTVLLAHSSSYQQGLLLVAAVYSILALSLDLVAGATGLYSLGHAGLFAIGAYGTTILATHYGWNIFLTLPVVVVAVGFVGVVIGALSLRVSGLYFAITTLIFTIIINVLLSNLNITGGYQGLASPTFPTFPHLFSPLGAALVWAVSGCVLVSVTAIWSIRSSALYPALLAIRDSEPFASSVGVRTALTRVAIFSLSAALAGLAGWAFCFLGYITPGQFDSTAAVNILVMVILGGMNTRLGPVLGAVFVSLFPVVVTINPLWQEIMFGSVFLLVIVLFPEGFVGLLARAGRRLRPGTASRAPSGYGRREELGQLQRAQPRRQPGVHEDATRARSRERAPPTVTARPRGARHHLQLRKGCEGPRRGRAGRPPGHHPWPHRPQRVR